MGFETCFHWLGRFLFRGTFRRIFVSMGGRSSTRRRYASSGASSCNYNTYPQSPYHHQVRQHPYYKPQHHHAPPSHRNYGGRTPQPHWRIDQKYSMIADDYTTLEQVSSCAAYLEICKDFLFWGGLLVLVSIDSFIICHFALCSGYCCSCSGWVRVF